MKRRGPRVLLGALFALAAVQAAAAGGPGGAAREEGSPVIGLFLPSSGPDAGLGKEILHGAELALSAANDAGGIEGRPLRTAVADSGAPWSGATSSLVRLIDEEGAVAIIGGLDLRSAHLALQVITRFRGDALLVIPWSSDASLTRLSIPWVFSIVPDDRLQSARLAEEIFRVRHHTRAAAWIGEGPDWHAAAEAFLRASPPGSVESLPGQRPESLPQLAAKLAAGDLDAVVLFTTAGRAADLSSWLADRGQRPALFGPLGLAWAGPPGETARRPSGAIVAVAGGSPCSDPEGFDRLYEERYGTAPTLAARYGHDAAAALASGLGLSAGEGGDGLARALRSVRLTGATGILAFDETGARSGPSALAILGEGGVDLPLGEEARALEGSPCL